MSRNQVLSFFWYSLKSYAWCTLWSMVVRVGWGVASGHLGQWDFSAGKDFGDHLALPIPPSTLVSSPIPFFYLLLLMTIWPYIPHGNSRVS